jgi:hypothetical protein
MAALRQAFLSAATEERMRELAEKLFAAALAGDWQAAKLLLPFVLGRPAAVVDPDRLDLDAWQLLDEAPSRAQVYERLLDALPPGEALDDFARTLAQEGFGARLRSDTPTNKARGVRAEVEARAGRKGRRG